MQGECESPMLCCSANHACHHDLANRQHLSLQDERVYGCAFVKGMRNQNGEGKAALLRATTALKGLKGGVTRGV